MRPARRLWASADGRAACLLVGCVLLFFAPIVAQRGVYFVGNSIEYFARFSYTADQLRAGRLPLWNPQHALGLSHAADPKAQAAYPVHLLLFLLLPKAPAYACDVVFHVLLAALGMFFLARAWGRSAEAAFLAGLSYGLGGFVLAHLQHFNHVVAIAWLPVLFLCVERFLETGSRMALGLGALTLGLQILGGHSQVVLYGGLVVGARVLMHLAQEWRSGSGMAAGRAILLLLGMVVAGLGLSAVFIVPYLELMTFSGRAQGMDLEYATSFSLEPERLAAFLYPFLFGGSPWGPERGPGSFAEMSPYVGLLPLSLAAVALTRRNGRIVFLAALACGGLILALGGYTPLGRLVFDLPVLRTGRAPARFLLAVTFALALLSAFGLDALRAGAARRRTTVLAGALLLVAAAPLLVAALGRMGHTLPRTMLGLAPHRLPTCAGIAFAVASASVLILWSRSVLRPDALVRLTLAVAVADLFFFAASLWGTYNATTPVSFYTDPSAPARRLIEDGDQPRFEYWSLGEEKLFSFVQKVDLPTYRELARDGLRASLPMTFGVRAQQGDWGDKLLAYADWQSAIGARGRFDRLAARLVGMFGGRYVLSQSPLALQDLQPVLQAGRVGMYRNAAQQPRAFVVSRATVVADRTAALRAIQDPAFDPRAAVVLEPPARPLVAEAAFGLGADIRVDDPEHVVIDVRSSQSAYLVLSDTFYPGWRATIDGRPTRIYRANSLVRAVAVDAGDRRVEFLYDPVTPKIGGTLSALSLVGLALYLRRQWRTLAST